MRLVTKMKKNKSEGPDRSLLETDLIEFIWRRKLGDRPFENLIRMIQEQCPLV